MAENQSMQYAKKPNIATDEWTSTVLNSDTRSDCIQKQHNVHFLHDMNCATVFKHETYSKIFGTINIL